MPPLPHQSYPRLMMIFAVFLVVATGLLWWSLSLAPRVANQNTNQQTACTEEAKICPDGSAVGRTGPDCEFAACPDVTDNPNGASYCTQDVKTCSDGSFVTRQSPSCDFSACPTFNTNIDGTNSKVTSTNTPTTSNTVPPAVPLKTYLISEVAAQPQDYDNLQLCLVGWYQSSFEFTALGPSAVRDADGNLSITEPYVDVYSTPAVTDNVCRDSGRGTQSCVGQSTVCGTFRYAAPGEIGYGISQNLRYHIDN